MTNETLCTMQQKLLEGSIGKVVGRYRTHQIWVGDRSGSLAIPSHIAPKAEDVTGYMDHFCAVTNNMTDAAHHEQIHPIAAAVVTSGLLAYIHPFDDGNGRVGRLLLQKPLTSVANGRRLYLPVSAAINRKRAAYYQALDAWSIPLLERISYEQHHGGVRVTNETKDLYRFPDLTRYAEFIAQACGEAVTKDLAEEQQILAVYDKIQPTLTAAGLTQAKADLFFKLAHQNGWKLGKKKARLFPELQEQQITALEDHLRTFGESAVNNRAKWRPAGRRSRLWP
jgi:Fic/DOC family